MDAWDVSLELVDAAYELTARFPVAERFGLVSQMQRSAVRRILPKVQVEAAREFSRFLRNARGSLCELETHYRIAMRRNYVEAPSAEYESCLHRLFAMLSGLLKSTKTVV